MHKFDRQECVLWRLIIWSIQWVKKFYKKLSSIIQDCENELIKVFNQIQSQNQFESSIQLSSSIQAF
jgi:hypothetical protein